MSPLYTFLKYCENSRLPKEILDCGAGGKEPPLYIFHLLGYGSHGVDISEEQLKKARDFCDKKGVELDTRKGDMRNLPFRLLCWEKMTLLQRVRKPYFFLLRGDAISESASVANHIRTRTEIPAKVHSRN
jgi:SAM-dependent methyltransferase